MANARTGGEGHLMRIARSVLFGVLVVGVFVSASAVLAAHPDYTYVDGWSSPIVPEGCDVDRDGNVYVVERDTPRRVRKYDPSGTVLDTALLGSSTPVDVAVDDDGHVYVTDAFNHGVFKFDSSLDYVDGWGGFGTAPGEFDQPAGIAVGRDGFVYVADGGNDRVQKLTPDGEPVRSWGTSGPSETLLTKPGGLAIGPDGDVWVHDASGRVRRFDAEGVFVDSWPASATNIDVDPMGDVVATDYDNEVVRKYSASGPELTEWGTSGSDPGELLGPVGVCADGSRNVFVADQADVGRIQKFFSPVPTEYDEVAGPTRYETAVEASKRAFPRGLEYEDVEGYRTVILTTGQNWPDALGGSALAGVLDAPVLLTLTDTLPDVVIGELARLDADRVIVLGGPGAVSGAIEQRLSALGFTGGGLERIGGATRYETADLIMDRVADITEPAAAPSDIEGRVYVATGLNFPDALSASPLATHEGDPILLATGAGLPPASLAALGDAWFLDDDVELVLLGGPDVVPAVVESQVKSALPGSAVSVTRLAGPTRYETALEIAEYGTGDLAMEWARPAIATGLNFPDALAGGVAQGHARSVLFLAQGDDLHPGVRSLLVEHKPEIYEVRYLGGIDVVSAGVRSDASSILY
jgi:putative cell wall-binding protein/streptogramin lyase